MRHVGTRIYVVAICCLALFSSYLLWTNYQFGRSHATEMASEQAGLALAFELAVRDYVAKEIRPVMERLLPPGEFMPETMSTSFVAGRIFDRVQRSFPGYVLKFSSDNPRNPANAASVEEAGILRMMREKGLEEWRGELTIGGKPYLARFRARIMEDSCLRCHGVPGDAPRSMVERYGDKAGFHRAVGEIIALDTVAVPLDPITGHLRHDLAKNSFVLLFGVGVAMLLIVISFRQLVVLRLRRLAGHFQHAASRPEGDPITPVEVRGADEISALCASFNLLAGRLHQYHLTLEDRVRERTVELESSNSRLRDQMHRNERTATALLASERRYRNVLESMEEGYVEINAHGGIVFFNHQFSLLAGRDEAELAGLFYEQLISPAMLDRVRAVFYRVMKNGEPARLTDFEMADASRAGRIYALSVSRWQGSDNEPLGWRAVIRDITELMTVQRDLEQSNAFHRTILDSLSESVSILDLDFRILAVNKAFCDDYGLTQAEVVGRFCHEVTHGCGIPCAPPDDPCPLRETVATGRVAIEEHRHLRRDLSIIYVEVATYPIFNEDGRVDKIVHVSRDISSRKEVELAREEAFRAAEGANRAKTEFLANMSHELRTPLNGIIGMAELAMDGRQLEDRGKICKTIRDEARFLLDIVGNVLDFSKIDSGAVSLERGVVDLRKVMEAAVVGFAPAAAGKGLSLDLWLPAGMPGQVFGDAGRISQVVRNLVGNALKFTASGGVEVTGEVEENGDRPLIRFEVRDTGIGIAPALQEKIFQEFYQVDGSLTRQYGGTGLGLAICQRLVRMMGGRIGVESAEGRGSRFWFTLSFDVVPDEGVEEEPPDPELAGRRVLILDRESLGRQAVADYLRFWGMRVTVSDSAAGMEDAAGVDLVVVGKDHVGGDEKSGPRVSGLSGEAGEVPALFLEDAGSPLPFEAAGRHLVKILRRPVVYDELRRAVLSLLCPGGGQAARLTETVTMNADVKPCLGKRILLVEDYPINQQVARLQLASVGYQVDVAANGEEAVSAFGANHYDLVLMDIQMPVMDGYQATAEIRRLEEAARGRGEVKGRTPIVAITAHASSEDRQKCLARGMDDFLAKPWTRGGLITMAGVWCGCEGSVPALDDLDETLETAAARPESPVALKSPVAKVEKKDSGWVVPADPAPGPAREGVSPVSGGVSILEWPRLVAGLGGNEEIARELVGELLETGRRQIMKVRQAVGRKDAETVRLEAHSLKGSSGNLTARSLAAAALALEQAAKKGDFPGIEWGCEWISGEFDRLERFLRDSNSK